MKPLRRGWRPRHPRGPTGLPPVLTGMWLWREQYLENLGARNYAPATIRTQADNLRRFLVWCDERSLTAPTDVTQPVLERYQRWLFYYRRPDGRAIGFYTQHQMLGTLKVFFRWLTRQRVTLFNPAAELELPHYSRRLPRQVLTANQAEAVMAQPDLSTLAGVRDRAILETFYSTGIRRQELANLTLYDLDASRGTLRVREGKNRKDRVVPIGQRALAWIDRYLTDGRPACVVEPDNGTLFLTVDGEPFRRLSVLGELVHRYLESAGVSKTGGCHVFRHTMATLMLENGADIRFIQEILGHARLDTTQIYTHVSIVQLQRIHQATHPAERKHGPEADTPPLASEADAARDELATRDEEAETGA